MFTGIVQGTGRLIRLEVHPKELSRTHWVRLPIGCDRNLYVGASVAHNGCCLTVTKKKEGLFAFHLMEETLKKTNLADLQEGDEVNIERALKIGDEIGGHLMSGHIVGTLAINHIDKKENSYAFYFALPSAFKPYVLCKGYIGLNGCSLTIGEVGSDYFVVYLVPETLQRTTFKYSQKGDLVNLEIDNQTQAVVDTTRRVLSELKETNNLRL